MFSNSFLGGKRFHRDEIMRQKLDVEATETFIHKLYKIDSLHDQFLSIIDSDFSIQCFRSFLLANAKAHVNYFDFIVVSKFIESDENQVDFSSFVGQSLELFKVYIDNNNDSNQYTTRIMVTAEYFTTFSDVLEVLVAGVDTNRLPMFMLVQSMRIQMIKVLIGSCMKSFMITQFYSTW
jgi:hypothetical protein